MKMPTHIVAVGGIVEDEQENILLVKTHHGGWVFPGGQVEVGENLMDALIREIKEESGIAITNLIGVYSNTGIYKWHDGVTDVPTKLMLDYVCKSIGGELSTSEETTEVRWVKREKVLDLISEPAIRTRFNAYLDFEGKINYLEYVTKPEFELKENRTI
ncbi:NUDIX hydrolase [Halalkalibacter sp. APA_J-10(15)]|uniref:NUDIX hydrolase n=1 Tax=Halalkalibacter sp. APA_J-10(15) TaxID=2933805 RepID=UPI001FF61D0A|nr:NUDIX hydrolase [Halalkalibacter sp. APA_J-10(15)]MCK0473280.1 NUDIX hydrolase [Halalkalibacter sp. APA_J-10(15)]